MQNPPRHKRTSQAGISLIELLISMIIMAIVSTMLVGAWISLQRSYAFAAAENKATGTARDALDRVASEIRDAQGITFSPSATPVPTTSTPFSVDATGINCGPWRCTFYSAYNKPSAALQSGQYGRDQLRLTAIWLDDIAGAQKQKTLYWQRDTSIPADGLDPSDRKVKLATNVVNAAFSSPSKPIFTYFFRTAGVYTSSDTLTTANVATLVSVQVDIIVDANLSHTPKYIDLKTTVQPRNQITP